MGRIKNILSMMISIVLLVITVSASETGPQSSYNADNYTYQRCAKVVNSYLYPNGTDQMTRVEYIDGSVWVENYSFSGDILSQTKITPELPLFGGFYSGNSCNYLVFGQNNEQQSNSTEVIRIIKYSKNWARLGSASIYGANTFAPFQAGSLRMVESGNVLIVRTCHTMYDTGDGLHHQANLTLSVNTSNMTVINMQSSVSSISTGYVSHSFNQLVAQNGSHLIAADHGDAYPRSVVICQYSNAMNSGALSGVSSSQPLIIPGEIGDNFTGVSIGGLEISSTSILLAGNSVDHDNHADFSSGRDIFLVVADRNNIGSYTKRWITRYGSDNSRDVTNPKLVKVNENEFILLWSEEDGKTIVKKLDGRGNIIDGAEFDERILSDCQPQVISGKVVWYRTYYSEPTFYYIDPGNISSLEKTGHIPLEKIKLSSTNITLNKGETKKITIRYTPSNTSDDKTVTWSSDDPSIASVSKNGTVTAKAPGKTVIKAKVSDLESQCAVTVKAPLQSISLTKTSLTIHKGETGKLGVKYNPSDTTDSKTVTWSSSNTEVVSVDTDGTLLANKIGTATITAKVGSKTAQCKVTVDSPLKSIKLSASTLTIEKGKTAKLSVKYNPSDTTDSKTVTWSSSSTEVAAVSSDGTVTAKKGGEATITAKAGNKSAKCQIKVTVPIKSIRLSETSKTVNKGRTFQLKVTLDPSDATGGESVVWKSSNENVATVSSDGSVTAKKPGRATISASAGGKTASCKITVKSPLSSISFSNDHITINKGEEARLTVKYNPADTTDDKTIVWSVNSPTTVSISSDGTIRGKNVGLAKVTATVGNKSATAIVTVKSPLKSIELSSSSMKLKVGERRYLTVSYKPDDTTDDLTIKWTSDDPSIATVSDLGEVQAVRTGKTNIRAKVGNHGSLCAVEVIGDHRSTCPSRKYTDVNPQETHWTHLPIDYVLKKGYMQGVAEGQFAPNGTVTRAQIVQMLYAKEGKPKVTGKRSFRDVREGSWYSDAVEWASSKGVVAGYANGTFKPNQAVTREQLVTIMYAYARYQGMDLAPSESLSAFMDAGSVSNYARIPMQWAVGKKIISGTGNGLEPKGRSTRAQIAVILRAYDSNVR